MVMIPKDMKRRLPTDPAALRDHQQRMLLSHFSLRYVVPRALARNHALREMVLDAVLADPALRAEFEHHLGIFIGQVPKPGSEPE